MSCPEIILDAGVANLVKEIISIFELQFIWQAKFYSLFVFHCEISRSYWDF